jgi:tRNA(fMet)-specific endonuclease VapC
MIGYMLDTDVLVHHLRGRQQTTQFLVHLDRGSRHSISTITLGEMVTGIEKGGNPESGDKQLDQSLVTIDVLEFDHAAAYVYGQIRARLQMSGNVIGDADVAIAATAIRHQRILVSGNRRHFERIQELHLIVAP